MAVTKTVRFDKPNRIAVRKAALFQKKEPKTFFEGDKNP